MDPFAKRLDHLNQRLETVATHLQSSVGKASSGQNCFSTNNLDSLPILRDYNAIINDSVAAFTLSSRRIGGELAIMIEHVTRLFDAQRDFLRQAIQTKKPANDQQITELIRPQSTEIEAIVALTNKSRKSTLFNHLSSISEGIPALGWILVSPTPAPHIKDMLDASQFYANRVLKDYKEKDPIHADWVKQWIKVLNDLHVYVKQYHTTGLTWGIHSKGDQDFATRNPTAATTSMANIRIDDTYSRNGFMSSINSLGANAASHLKRVPDELKTHKNQHMREQPIERPNRTQMVTSASSSNSMSGTPKFALEGNKWIVEYQNGQADLKITDGNMRQTVYIYKCSNSTITIQTKVNSIVLDQCTKVGLQFTSAVSLVEFVNCRSMKAQVLDSVPTIQIEKTDGCHIYLSKNSLNTEFITAKSSEITINVPQYDGEYKEYPVPEQFKTYLQHGKQLVTVPNESSGV